jgi:exosortase
VQNEPQIVQPTPAALPALARWQFAVLASLFLWLYGRTLAHLVVQWWQDPDFSHGFLVPFFFGFMIWRERERLRRIVVKPSWLGLLLIALALCVLVVGQLGAELFLARLSLLLLVAGLIALFLGWNFLWALSFPLAFLLLMIPLPAIIFNQITFPLQLLASRVVAATLPLFSVPVLREGNVLKLPGIELEVAEACSGIRSLMSLVTLAVIYGYLTQRRVAVRWLLALGAVPISVAANSVRIIGTGLLAQYWGADKAKGFFHIFSGWLIFVVSLLMLYLLDCLIRILWREKESKS